MRYSLFSNRCICFLIFRLEIWCIHVSSDAIPTRRICLCVRQHVSRNCSRKVRTSTFQSFHSSVTVGVL